MTTYEEYVSDDQHMREYMKYQERYTRSVRESDKILIGMVEAALASRSSSVEAGSVLDIGCSTGNFLFHLRRHLPELRLTGCDAVATVIDECRSNTRLEGIEFLIGDATRLELTSEFDVVTANALVWVLDPTEFQRTLLNANRALRSGGWFIAFDLFTEFDQDTLLIERSSAHPEGLPLYFRSWSSVSKALLSAGFGEVDFQPFDIPIDIAKPEDRRDITSYTVRVEDGRRLCFRGAIAQPWCFVRAQKQE